jgi:hypothetical protein
VNREEAARQIASAIHAYDHPIWDQPYCVFCLGEAEHLLDNLPPGGDKDPATDAYGAAL